MTDPGPQSNSRTSLTTKSSSTEYNVWVKCACEFCKWESANSSSASSSKESTQSPKKLQKKCTTSTVAPKLANWVSYSLNGAIGALSMLKEATGGLGVAPPGLRQAAGSALWIVETVALMGDNKDLFKDLVQQCLDYTLIVIRLAIRVKEEQEEGADFPPEFMARAMEFGKAMQSTECFLKRMLNRGRFARIVFARADKLTFERKRDGIAHAVTQFNLFMQADIYIRVHNPKRDSKKASKEDVQLDVKKVKQLAMAAIQEQYRPLAEEIYRLRQQEKEERERQLAESRYLTLPNSAHTSPSTSESHVSLKNSRVEAPIISLGSGPVVGNGENFIMTIHIILIMMVARIIPVPVTGPILVVLETEIMIIPIDLVFS
ncbi:hypothetical protein CC1G_08807 [Coprinopsis cinerea okayama7|uniref:Uncharacterized protein n=1 Tax=Coprinopsis cinerea (strain Okayama-7 / 130 / ATCC MYA-4618 / FGSC 9003) TaxID=240176 RepID=A8N457_COPC7|nr:hypothetical protein CC1G_08807 [Coprinopsis cinerea okayama7\|eukprot:XP_001829652.1 hypothetical protein CC1G_08807 [Coprinopsis cinerea okayama7\